MSSKSHTPTLATQLRPWLGNGGCLGGSLWVQGGIGGGDEGDGEFDIFLEMVLEMSLHFWKTTQCSGRSADLEDATFCLQTRSVYELSNPSQVP